MYLFPHNKKWKSEFKSVRDSIISTYEGDIEIFHIGSTAIAGLYAKDCIDLLGVVKDISKVSTFKQSIVDLGFVYRGQNGISGREYFSKKHRKVHLHIFQSGDVNVEKHLHFVQVMKNNVALITELNQVKQGLHAKYPNDKVSYQNEKEFFYSHINKVL
jgi:GrpB-like predicted nucleotidyltransferase (UPF0157 family)